MVSKSNNFSVLSTYLTGLILILFLGLTFYIEHVKKGFNFNANELRACCKQAINYHSNNKMINILL